ncbi:hypothetical protein Pelo_8263 [Pelomyxa schiedti]|nr:hypothetical protein Pelo_8263 [Pelomyxa schiedti]
MAAETDDVDCLMRLLMVGDFNVGKTSLLVRFTEDTFDSEAHTIGLDFVIGTHLEWKNSRQSQNPATEIPMEFFLFMISHQNAPFRTAGTGSIKLKNLEPKACDLESLRSVSTDQGRELASHLEIPFQETSAKYSNTNVETAILQMVQHVLDHHPHPEHFFHRLNNTQGGIEVPLQQAPQPTTTNTLCC